MISNPLRGFFFFLTFMDRSRRQESFGIGPGEAQSLPVRIAITIPYIPGRHPGSTHGK